MLPKRSSTTTWSECAACLRRFTGASQAKRGAVSHHNEFARHDASTTKNRLPKETNYPWRGDEVAQFVRQEVFASRLRLFRDSPFSERQPHSRIRRRKD